MAPSSQLVRVRKKSSIKRTGGLLTEDTGNRLWVSRKSRCLLQPPRWTWKAKNSPPIHCLILTRQYTSEAGRRRERNEGEREIKIGMREKDIGKGRLEERWEEVKEK